MKCALCNKIIENYNPLFHQLKINDSRSVDICQDCTDKFLKWQSSTMAKLFPSKLMKKRFENKE
ncbi:MAG: hypothetical protein WC755_02330 [Candidatus Woesearchaeota archaeon]|jgi:hypothetical protein